MPVLKSWHAHDCVKRLLEIKEEDTIACLCTLMATIGKLLDREEARHYMDYYFDKMKQTANEIGSNAAQFPSGVRLKVMILDTIDLRKNRYVLPFVLVMEALSGLS
jgi:translation initiation factor 4G